MSTLTTPHSQSKFPPDALYGYIPDRSVAIFATAYFGLLCLIILAQVIFGRYKHWWLLSLALGAFGEALGWACRIWAFYDPLNWMAYTIQLCSLAVTPITISAATYFLFSAIIAKLSTRLFGLPDRCYWAFFLLCDLVAIGVQTVGAVKVSSLSDIVTGAQDKLDYGNSILRSGIAFQLSNTVIFSCLVLLATGWQWFRGRRTMVELAGRPTMLALGVCTLMLLVRNGFRVKELAGGYNDAMMRDESYLIGLDMVPIAIAVTALALVSPSVFLSPAKHDLALSRV